MALDRPKTVTIYNLNRFFDFRSISAGAVKPGMFIQFRYASPLGVHDVKPLVFVLENNGDRVFGINFHYQFPLFGDVITLKDAQVKEFIEKSSEWKKYQKELTTPSKEEVMKDEMPDVETMTDDMKKKLEKKKKEDEKKAKEQPKVFDKSKLRFPSLLLEDFSNDKLKPSKEILRNYLFVRMSSLQKLVYKVI